MEFFRKFIRFGTATLPLTENHSAQKPLAELGGTPPPLMEKSAK